jgi:hypothetical protein
MYSATCSASLDDQKKHLVVPFSRVRKRTRVFILQRYSFARCVEEALGTIFFTGARAPVYVFRDMFCFARCSEEASREEAQPCIHSATLLLRLMIFKKHFVVSSSRVRLRTRVCIPRHVWLR